MTFKTQDYIYLGGDKSPGLATVGKAGSPRRWEERQGYGLSGAWLFYTGDGLASFDVTFYLWLPEHKEQWDAFAKKQLARPTQGTRPQAKEISHPLLESEPHVIKSVVVEDVSSFELDEYGGRSCVVKFKQYRAPMPLLGKPNRSISKPTNVITAKSAEERTIEELTKLAADPDKLRFGT